MKTQMRQTQRGYSLVEVLFYISIFTALSLVVINSLVIMTKAFRETTASADLVQSASIMERISREIRQANSINFITETDLRLNAKDDAGQNKTVEFKWVNPNVQLLENNALIGNMNTPNIQVTALAFNRINTAEGTAVKVGLSVQSIRDGAGRIETFYDTVVLRGDYGS